MGHCRSEMTKQLALIEFAEIEEFFLTEYMVEEDVDLLVSSEV